MDRNRQRLAVLAQVEVVTCGVQALEAAPKNRLLADVAAGGMPHLMFRRNPEHNVMWVGYLDEDVVGMLLRGDSEATGAAIKVGAVCAFESIATDPGIAEVAGCIMDRLLNGASNVVNDNSAGL